MKVKVLKSDSYIAFIEGFIAVPVISNSLSDLKKEAVNEVYRVCNFLEKRLPKDANNAQLLPVETTSESVKNLSENLFYVGFCSKAFKEYKTLFIQSAFSFKLMVDGLTNGGEYLARAVTLILDCVGVKGEGSIIETAFTAIEVLENLYTQNDLLAYKRIVKLCYLLTSYALSVYNAEKPNGAFDAFYFD